MAVHITGRSGIWEDIIYFLNWPFVLAGGSASMKSERDPKVSQAARGIFIVFVLTVPVPCECATFFLIVNIFSHATASFPTPFPTPLPINEFYLCPAALWAAGQ